MKNFGDRFGKITETRVDGNKTEIVQRNVIKGEIKLPVRKRYEERFRVGNQKEELELYLKFSDELNKDRSMLDPAWRIERIPKTNERIPKTNDYYVVKCYTRLEY